jgi:hypothetical protein
MTAKTAFNTDEWNLLRSMVPLVSAGVAAADPSGLFGSIKEAASGTGAMVESLKKGGDLELMKEMLADRRMPAMPDPKALMGEGSREEQLAGFRAASIARAREAVELVRRKAAPAEAAAYQEMLLAVADRAANAAREGGFLASAESRSAPRSTPSSTSCAARSPGSPSETKPAT